MPKNKKLLLLAAMALLVLALTPFLGIVAVAPGELLGDGTGAFVFWNLRLPRALLGFAAGAILALSGLVCQILFKNDLATPDLLGISPGAAAGAVVALKLRIAYSCLGPGAAYLFSFLGALGAILAVLAIARAVKRSSLYTFLMSGVAINFFFSSLIVLCQYAFDFADTYALLRWLAGGIAVAGFAPAAFLWGLLFVFLGLVLLFREEFLLLSAGDDFAATRGLDVAAFRRLSFLGLAVFVGAVVSLCGPIGFVALVVPHVARSWGNGAFRHTVVFSALLGGGLLVSADFLARSLLPPLEIPVGIVTSLLGAPFFLFLLLAQLKRME